VLGGTASSKTSVPLNSVNLRVLPMNQVLEGVDQVLERDLLTFKFRGLFGAGAGHVSVCPEVSKSIA